MFKISLYFVYKNIVHSLYMSLCGLRKGVTGLSGVECGLGCWVRVIVATLTTMSLVNWIAQVTTIRQGLLIR